jgi:microcystin-dependent protein
MAWYDLTFTASHVLTASDMNRMQENFTALAAQDSGSPAVPPTGAVIPYAGTSAPAGWLLCRGQAVSRDAYARLFGVIGTTFGAGDGSTTFNVPDLRGRAVVALDNLGGSSADRITATWADSLGGAGGAETHQLTTGELPSHTHPGPPVYYRVGAHDHNSATQAYAMTPNPADGQSGSAATGATGGGGAHNNLQPAMALAYIIKT